MKWDKKAISDHKEAEDILYLYLKKSPGRLFLKCILLALNLFLHYLPTENFYG